MVLVFDLDDTLFDGMMYVYSGMHAVSLFLEKVLGLDQRVIYTELITELKKERNLVFDRFLHKRGIYSKRLVKECLSVYRTHDPGIKLISGAKQCLKALKNFPLYIVTDGNQRVQRKKFLALGLDSVIKKCLCTYAYGLKHSKPSTYCFEKICREEKVKPNQVIYIGDNPLKDFVGIKSLGFHTVRVLTGPYKLLKVEPNYDAEKTILSLNELPNLVKTIL